MIVCDAPDHEGGAGGRAFCPEQPEVRDRTDRRSKESDREAKAYQGLLDERAIGRRRGGRSAAARTNLVRALHI